MKKGIIVLLVAFVLSSCTEDIKRNDPAFQAKLDQTLWRTTTTKVSTNENGGLNIIANSGFEYVTLNIKSLDPGKYVLGTADKDNYATYSIDNGQEKRSYTTSSNSSGAVFNVTEMTSGGSGYIQSNSALTTGGSGSGLKVAYEVDNSGKVTKITAILARGGGYKAGETITIIGGDYKAKFKILNLQHSNGEIVIEKVVDGAVTGTFKFSAFDENSGEVITFSQGVFYNVR